MVTKLVLIAGWAMAGMQLRRLRRGLGGIAGSDQGEGFVRRCWAFRRSWHILVKRGVCFDVSSPATTDTQTPTAAEARKSDGIFTLVKD